MNVNKRLTQYVFTEFSVYRLPCRTELLMGSDKQRRRVNKKSLAIFHTVHVLLISLFTVLASCAEPRSMWLIQTSKGARKIGKSFQRVNFIQAMYFTILACFYYKQNYNVDGEFHLSKKIQRSFCTYYIQTRPVCMS